MNFLLEFLHQKVPQSGREIPAYYQRALRTSTYIQGVYFLTCFFLYPLIIGHWLWVPLLFLAGAGFAIHAVRRWGTRINLLIYAALCFSWVGWSVYTFGWGSGTQHFLTLLLVFVFFEVCEKPWVKILWFLLILAFRIGLYSWSLGHPALYELTQRGNTVYQTLNTVAFLLTLALMCIIFSTSIQDTERQLRLRNQTLYKAAGTDPLTGLPNRRAMIEQIEKYIGNGGEQTFSVAIADIDFFKQINDTYGHHCGDYTLVKLTELFVEHSNRLYSAARWGGEEFCLFIPGKNLDEAGSLMNDLCLAVERMKLNFEGQDFSITITIGVEEYDFSSPLEDLLKSADEKLYMGKNAGRNRVVF